MSFEGGTLDRAVHQSVYNHLKDRLTNIGWFTAGRNHSPINFISGRPKAASESTVPVNTVALVDEEVSGESFEMGSDATANCYKYALEMYAESEAVGRALMGDVRKILLGNYPGQSIYPIIDLYDYTQTPAVYIRYMDVCDVKWSHPTTKDLYQRYWFKVEWTVTDYDL